MINAYFKILEVKCYCNCAVLKLTVYTNVSCGNALSKKKHADATEQ